VVAQTVGHRQWRSSRGGAVDPCGSPQSVGLAGGVPEAVVDGGRLAEEEAVGSRAFAGGVAVGLGLRSVSTEEDIEAHASAALDGHRRAWRWSATTKQATDGGEWSRGEGGCEEAKWERRTLPLGVDAWIRALAHVGR
jgi:hypothetical protein